MERSELRNILNSNNPKLAAYNKVGKVNGDDILTLNWAQWWWDYKGVKKDPNDPSVIEHETIKWGANYMDAVMKTASPIDVAKVLAYQHMSSLIS